MNFYAYIIHNAQAANTFNQLFFFKRMRRPNHYMDFYATGRCTNKFGIPSGIFRAT